MVSRCVYGQVGAIIGSRETISRLTIVIVAVVRYCCVMNVTSGTISFIVSGSFRSFAARSDFKSFYIRRFLDSINALSLSARARNAAISAKNPARNLRRKEGRERGGGKRKKPNAKASFPQAFPFSSILKRAEDESELSGRSIHAPRARIRSRQKFTDKRIEKRSPPRGKNSRRSLCFPLPHPLPSFTHAVITPWEEVSRRQRRRPYRPTCSLRRRRRFGLRARASKVDNSHDDLYISKKITGSIPDGLIITTGCCAALRVTVKRRGPRARKCEAVFALPEGWLIVERFFSSPG